METHLHKIYSVIATKANTLTQLVSLHINGVPTMLNCQPLFEVSIGLVGMIAQPWNQHYRG